MTDVLSLPPSAAAAALAEWLGARGEPAYRARQIVPRLWRRPVPSWAEATDVPASLRRDLDAAFPLLRPISKRSGDARSNGTARAAPSSACGLPTRAAAIEFGKDGRRRWARIGGGVFDCELEGVEGRQAGTESWIDNVRHPVSSRLAAARAALIELASAIDRHRGDLPLRYRSEENILMT